MSFLTPLFLLGLAALAGPVLIHLSQRERKQVVVFPSLMFLQRIPYKSVRRRTIRHWMLLLLRAAAILLIVAAFARPFFGRLALASVVTSGSREVVILLDRSYSMAYGDHWERARAAARQAVDALGSSDRVTLIFFADSAEIDIRSTADRGRVLGSINTASVGSGATRYVPALKLAQSILEQSALPHREAVLISDFQEAGWKGAEGVQLPQGAVLTPLSVADPKTSNLLVSSAAFQHTSADGRERITVSAILTNRSADPVTNLPVALELDGLQSQALRASLAPNASTTVALAPFNLSASYTRGTVRAGSDALPQDNVFHFVLSPRLPVPVVIFGRGDATSESNLYLTRALAIGGNPSFKVEVASLDRLAAATLQSRSVIVLNDLTLPSGPAGDQLKRFVENGGGLLILLGERGGWQAPGDWLPGSLGPTVDRSAGSGGTLSLPDYGHPIFELFKAPRSGDFSAARFFRYRQLRVEPPGTALAHFDDGAVALAERKVGRGRVMVWTSTMDAVWNNLALKPVFLPFVHRLAGYLAAYSEPAPWLTVGQVLERPEPNRVALTPSGRRVPLVGREGSSLVELTEQGFYEIRAAVGAREPRPLAVAANLDRAESDLSPLDPHELVGAVTGHAGPSDATAEAVEATPADLERQQAIWWYLLLVGVIVLAVETIIASRLSPLAH